ncbi:hypothetical protein Cadr_000004664 [Camelus dromedarius]|uniref:Uncharacterized protein n=1 Tax=Camelus dromedarius TaxID=9838 RepID=A0A5N4EE90_CAMDR|nr:hypothetical protein Cadr_000004664 [Camelus dromedarius]
MPKLWEDDLNFLFDYYKMCSGDNVLLKTKNDQQRGPAAQTSQKSCEAEPQVLPSLGLLEEDNSEPPSQQLQATSPRGSEPLSNLDFSHGPRVALESLPFFCTYGQLLAEEELAPEVMCRLPGSDQEGDAGLLLQMLQDDRQQWVFWNSRDSGLDAPLSSDVAFSSQALCASGFVPYYRTPEEGLHTSPGPPASPP